MPSNPCRKHPAQPVSGRHHWRPVRPKTSAAAIPEALDCRQIRFKIAEKSRRTGLTWAEAADAALNGSMAASAGGCDTFYVGTTKDMAREFIDACAMGPRPTTLLPVKWAKRYWSMKTKTSWSTSSTSPAASRSRRSALTPPTCGDAGNVVIDEGGIQKTLQRFLKLQWP